jgi:hypothetical protein
MCNLIKDHPYKVSTQKLPQSLLAKLALADEERDKELVCAYLLYSVHIWSRTIPIVQVSCLAYVGAKLARSCCSGSLLLLGFDLALGLGRGVLWGRRGLLLIGFAGHAVLACWCKGPRSRGRAPFYSPGPEEGESAPERRKGSLVVR